MHAEALFIIARVETNKWLFTGEQINKHSISTEQNIVQ